MHIHILTLFPEIVEGPIQASILARAQEQGYVNIDVVNIRDFAIDKHKVADDYPYGGGAGMVLKPEPIFRAFESLRSTYEAGKMHNIFVTPQGEPFNQDKALELACFEHIVILCGHYEGVDERVREALIDEELSLGDYVLTGGELPALVITDAVARLIPGVLGNSESALNDSFMSGLLDYPQYTRPQDYRGMRVPEVLLSGNHAAIDKWRKEQAKERTKSRRPDLWRKIQEPQQ